ncbi:hypothetical protein KAK07_20180 [Ideonella sp. 4Y16]|uniref:Uncharacterized protein n=1 Tax=Ideonella alba TaxID=2824118 RepID=A0A940Y8M2_9BURK|nr:hypothetical protein [Ideonella alba]MBQ0932049.1 hypothetical protein [Ideonella alba]MBQ0945669.1 hypothetical protein [Ideonella alba]
MSALLRTSASRVFALSALFVAAAAAAAPAITDLPHMAPAQRAQALQALRQTPALPMAALDTTPPVVVSINAGTTVDAGKSMNQLVVDLNVTDDLSGLLHTFMTARSPSGAQTVANGQHLGGWTAFKGQMALRFGPFAEPGVWTITEVYGSDIAGNNFVCDAACLGALGGNLQFTVTGTRADAQAPTLSSGRILTPAVSLSTPVKGTLDHLPIVRMQLGTADQGGSGTAGAYATFCLPDQSSCFGTWSENWVYAQKKSTLYGYASTWVGMPIGTYLLKDVTLHDHAGSTRVYTSTAFGGSTDFAPWFPNGTQVIVNP